MRTRILLPRAISIGNADDLRVLLLHNPGAGDDGLDVDELVSLIERSGHDVSERSVKDDGWAASLERRVDLVVAAGGDGTVVDVFSELPGRGLTATLLPLGTANNIATSLGLESHDVAALVRGWEHAARRWFDLGALTWADGSRRFVESAGGGLFADLLDRAERAADDRSGDDKVEFGLRLLAELVEEAPAYDWRLELDGVELWAELLGLAALNVGRLGPSLNLAPRADPGDGLLEVALIRPQDRQPLLRHVAALGRNETQVPLALDVRSGRHLTFDSPSQCRLHVDDELLGSAEGVPPYAVSIVAGLNVLLPV